MKFFPMPPKSCLTTTMAKNAPTTGIHSGTDTGRFIQSSSPVTTAERSPMVTFRCRSISVAASKPTEQPTDSTHKSSARHPNTYTPQNMAGMRAMITSSMMEEMFSGLRRCGEGDTVRNSGIEIFFTWADGSAWAAFSGTVFSSGAFCKASV